MPPVLNGTDLIMLCVHASFTHGECKGFFLLCVYSVTNYIHAQLFMRNGHAIMRRVVCLQIASIRVYACGWSMWGCECACAWGVGFRMTLNLNANNAVNRERGVCSWWGVCFDVIVEPAHGGYLRCSLWDTVRCRRSQFYTHVHDTNTTVRVYLYAGLIPK